MRFTSPFAALACATLACAAGPRPSPAPPPGAIAPPRGPAGPAASATARRVSRGMDAAQVRSALGEPARKEKVGSAAAPGAAYERWIYGDREVVLLEGKVVDVVP
jgi:hypothetical protein